MAIFEKETVAVWKSGTAFEITAGSGGTVVSDGDAQAGMSPMEMLLAALAGCTGADVIDILRKKRQKVTRFELRVSGERTETHPRVYTAIEVTYIVTGHGIDPSAVRRAIELSEGKYCSVSAMLCKTAKLSTKFEVHEAEAAKAEAQA